MAISAIQPVSGFGEVALIGALQARRRVSVVEQAPQVALPSVTVTLGASQSLPALYNSAGLLRSLIAVDSANGLPSGPLPGSDQASLQGDLGVLLRVNADTTNSGLVNATGSTATLSVDTLPALDNLLADRLGDAGGGERRQAESDLLAQLLSAASSGLNGATAGASVLNATGVLQGPTADTAGKALDSLLTTDLGLAARALDANSARAAALATPSLLQNPPNDATGFALDSILAAQVQLATAASNASSLSLENLDTSSASPVKDDLLRSSLNLSGGSGGLLTGGGLLATGTAVALPETMSAEAATRVLAGLLREVGRDDALPAIELGTVAVADAAATAAPPTTAGAPASARAATNPDGSALATTIGSAATELPAPVNDPAATAINTAAGNPAYAEAAAAFYLSTAMYRSQAHPGNPGGPDEEAENRAISRIQYVPGLKAR